MQSRYSMNQKKKKPYIKWIIITVFVLLAGSAAFWLYLHDWDTERSLQALKGSEVQDTEAPDEKPEENEAAEEGITIPEEKAEEPEETLPELPEPEEPVTEEKIDATKYPEDIELPKEPTIVNGILLANKQHPLPESYAPGVVKEAKDAFESMRQEALDAGLDLVAFSTYRDFNRQKELYEGYVAKDGQEKADRYSARPGFSEHQTGLAFDIGEAGQEQHWASVTFGETEGGKWLAENAHRYGFILRYPEGSENITGYMHESWHFRFVGEKAATEIHEKGITLEEYLEV